MFKIVADSAADSFELRNIDFDYVPMTISTDERSFVDTGTNSREMVDYLASYKGRSFSACPSSDAWLEAFGDAKYVFAVAITSHLSGSYNAARVAAEDYMEAHPDRRVYVLDTLSAGPGMRILIYKLRDLILECNSFDEICEKIERYKAKTELVFCLASLKNFANNGRVSPAVAKIAMVLNMRIVGKAENGELQVLDKVRGAKKGLEGIISRMESLSCNGRKILIDHCHNREGAETLRDMLKAKYENAKIQIRETSHLCSFYAENEGILVGFETN